MDALAEAGFCYAQGIGCKKNLKKSAKYYREAEAKGMSMVGNSWYVFILVFLTVFELGIWDRRLTTRNRIHKPKYADDPKDGKDSKHSRNKSKSRKTLFGWNHS